MRYAYFLIPQRNECHECDLLNVIELSKKLGECPEKILIFAIQSARMAPSMKLSPPLKMKLPEFAKDVLEIVHHIECVLK